MSRVKTLRGAADGNAPARNLGKLHVVENSGIYVSAVCLRATAVFKILAETKTHVYQVSRYGDLSANESIWFVSRFEVLFSIFNDHPIDRFWFFAARKNPETAPLITWFNGGVSGAD